MRSSQALSRLGLRQILMIEISVCVLIAALCVASDLARLDVWANKMQIIGLAGSADIERMEAIEHFDMTGGFGSQTPSDAIRSPDPTRPVTAEDQQSHVLFHQRFAMRDNGFTVTTINSLGRPMSVDFTPQISDGEAYTVLWQCQSSNLPLAVVRTDGLQGDHEALAACRAAAR